MYIKTILLFAALCAFTGVYAQIPGNLNALNTAGHTGTAGGTTYTYSVGELVTHSNTCAFTPGVVQPRCLLCVPVSEVFDQRYNSRFYPNPTNNQIIVETDFPDFTRYSICALDGRILETGSFTYAPLNFEQFLPGAYFLQLSSDNNQVFKNIKIIKQ